MPNKEDFKNLLENIKVERDEINLKLHLASMELKEEIEEAEKQWVHVKAKASEIANDTKEVSEDFLAKAKIVGEELKETYRRINKRLSS